MDDRQRVTVFNGAAEAMFGYGSSEMVGQPLERLAMDLRTVAGGVEQAAQVDVLREVGADLLQGYYFGQATPASELRWVSEYDQAI